VSTKPNYIQRKAELWRRIKAAEHDIPTIEYASSSLEELEAHLQAVENGEMEPELPKGDYCRADCEAQATKYLRLRQNWGWEIKPFGAKENIPYYVQGPLISYCPFCGRRMEPHG